jgi:hypothetical protein
MRTIVTIFVFCLLIASCATKHSFQPFEVSATSEFKNVEKKAFVPFYIHKEIDALAINSVKYGSAFAIAAYTFNEPSGMYNIKITTIVEDDGEPVYQLLINDKLVSMVQNEETKDNFKPRVNDFGDFKLKKGDVISITFNATTNGKIPEGNFTAYARGRWKNLLFTRLSD